jgi:hypothetical protein
MPQGINEPSCLLNSECFSLFCSGIVSTAILEMHLDTLHLNILNDNVYLHKAISQKKYNVATLFIYYPSSNCIVLANCFVCNAVYLFIHSYPQPITLSSNRFLSTNRFCACPNLLIL